MVEVFTSLRTSNSNMTLLKLKARKVSRNLLNPAKVADQDKRDRGEYCEYPPPPPLLKPILNEIIQQMTPIIPPKQIQAAPEHSSDVAEAVNWAGGEGLGEVEGGGWVV